MLDENPKKFVVFYKANLNSKNWQDAIHCMAAYTAQDALVQAKLLLDSCDRIYMLGERKLYKIQRVEPYVETRHGGNFNVDDPVGQWQDLSRSVFVESRKILREGSQIASSAKSEEPTCCWPVTRGNERRRCGETAGAKIHRDGFIGMAPHEFRADIEDEIFEGVKTDV